MGVVGKLPKVELVTKHFQILQICNASDVWGGVFECAIGFWYVNLCMNNGSLDANYKSIKVYSSIHKICNSRMGKG